MMGERTPLLRGDGDSFLRTDSIPQSRSESLSRTTTNIGPEYGALSLIMEGTSVSGSPTRTVTIEVPMGNGHDPGTP